MAGLTLRSPHILTITGGRPVIIAVFGGMLLASFIGVLFVPALFAGLELLMTRRKRATVPAE